MAVEAKFEPDASEQAVQTWCLSPGPWEETLRKSASIQGVIIPDDLSSEDAAEYLRSNDAEAFRFACLEMTREALYVSTVLASTLVEVAYQEVGAANADYLRTTLGDNAYAWCLTNRTNLESVRRAGEVLGLGGPSHLGEGGEFGLLWMYSDPDAFTRACSTAYVNR